MLRGGKGSWSVCQRHIRGGVNVLRTPVSYTHIHSVGMVEGKCEEFRMEIICEVYPDSKSIDFY
jgi:hypothetical protein